MYTGCARRDPVRQCGQKDARLMRWHATHSLRLLIAGTQPNVPFFLAQFDVHWAAGCRTTGGGSCRNPDRHVHVDAR
jgi:hypothetical protein